MVYSPLGRKESDMTELFMTKLSLHFQTPELLEEHSMEDPPRSGFKSWPCQLRVK